MSTLFPDNQTTATVDRRGLLKPTPHLARHAGEYTGGRGHRPAADPIGRGGLPHDRDGLNALLLNLCERLASAGGKDLGGKQLIEELGLVDTRSLRLLVAYGHVHHRLRQIVGTPGSGYCWGDLRPEIYNDMAASSRRMGLCFLFLASLYSRRPAAIEMAQLTLDLAEQSTGEKIGDGTDELTAWMVTEGATHADLIESMVDLFAGSEAGLAALRNAGRNHPGAFFDERALQEIETQLQSALAIVRSPHEKTRGHKPDKPPDIAG